MEKPVVVILSVSSDIGFYLARRYLRDGYRVIGTFRHYHYKIPEKLESSSDCAIFYCDVSDKASIEKVFINELKQRNIRWDVFISCVGDLRPYGSFFEADFETWSESIHINSIEQLRVIHALYSFRNNKVMPSVVFFAGGGVNSAPIGLSAYTASKIMLIKMCELLDAETPGIKAFIVGPGYVETKIHDLIKADIAKGKKETNLADVYNSIRWLTAQDKKIVGGRNFSIAHDPLFGVDACALAKELIENPEMYKLRRCGNNRLSLASLY